MGHKSLNERAHTSAPYLVPGDELVTERQTGHETALLQPKDGRETPREEDTLHGGEGDDALAEGCRLVGDPVERPVGLLLHTGQRLDLVKQPVPGGEKCCKAKYREAKPFQYNVLKILRY